MSTLRAAAVVLIAAVLSVGLTGDALAAFTSVQTPTAVTPEDSTNAKSVSISCPAGTRVIGTGADLFGAGFGEAPGSVLRLTAVRPNDALTSVMARAREHADGTDAVWRLQVVAICAPAPGGLVRRTVISATNSAPKTVVATCPSGRRLLGVGGELGGGGGHVLFDALVPDQPLTRTTVEAVEDEAGTGSSWTVTAYAICSNPVTGLQRASAGSSVDSVSPKSVTAQCAPGKVMIGSGGSVSAPAGQVALNRLRPSGPGSLAGAWEDLTGTAADWRVTAYAICASRAFLASIPAPPQPSPQPSSVTHQVVCPPDMPLMSYGAHVTSGSGEVWLRSLRTEDLGFAQVVAAATPGFSPTWTLTAHAVCATPIPGATVATAAGPLDTVAVKSATATCPAGTRVTGAGGEAVGAPPGNEGFWVLEGVRPNSTLTSVTANLRTNFAGVGEWQARAWAVCAPPPRGLQRVTATAPSSADTELGSVSAQCPAGKHVVGVGGEILGGLGFVGLDDLRPDAPLTRASVTATRDANIPEPFPPWSVRAYAICVNR